MVSNAYSSSRTNEGKKPLTKMEYDDFMAEINSITEHLTKTRTTLWETQDSLRASEQKVQQLEMHIDELVAAREKDFQQIKGLQKENTQCLEEEMKIRESMDLMKKVFTRTQLKSKEDQKTIGLLQEERDLLLQENKKLRTEKVDQDNELALLQEEKGLLFEENKLKSEKLEEIELEKSKMTDAQKSASVLATALEQTRAELIEFKKKQACSDETIQELQKKILEQQTFLRVDEKSRKQNTNDREIKNEVQRTERRNDSEDEFDESEIVFRAYLDEDLDDGLARNLAKNLDCGSINDTNTSNVFECGSFGNHIPNRPYSFFGFGRRPQTSM